MSTNGRGISNYICILILVLSLGCMLGGWVTLKDETNSRKLKNGVEDVKFGLRHLDDDTLDDVDDFLDQYHIPLSTNKAVKLMKQICNMLEDAAFSPWELTQISVGWSKVGSGIVDEIEDNYKSMWFGEQILMFAESVEDVFVAVIVAAVLDFICFIVLVVALVREIMNKKDRGFGLIIMAGVAVVYNMIMVSKINSEFSRYVSRYLSGDDLLKTTMFPWILVFFVLAYVVVKLVLKDNIGAVSVKAGNPAVGFQRKQAAGLHCPKCQSAMSADAAFCPNCGSSVAGYAANSPSSQNGQRYCNSCGTVIADGVVFCPNCGTKQE